MTPPVTFILLIGLGDYRSNGTGRQGNFRLLEGTASFFCALLMDSPSVPPQFSGHWLRWTRQWPGRLPQNPPSTPRGRATFLRLGERPGFYDRGAVWAGALFRWELAIHSRAPWHALRAQAPADHGGSSPCNRTSPFRCKRAPLPGARPPIETDGIGAFLFLEDLPSRTYSIWQAWTPMTPVFKKKWVARKGGVARS